MITTTLGTLVETEDLLKHAASQGGMTPKTKYAVAKLIRLIGHETDHWRKERAALFDRLGEDRESRTPNERQIAGPTVREIPAANYKEFQAAIKALNEVEVSIDWNPIPSNQLPEASAADVANLGVLCDLVDPDSVKP